MSEHIVSFQARHPGTVPQTERRAWVRFPTSQDICCQPMTGTKTAEAETDWSGSVRDISAGGMALVLRRPVEPGTVLSVELPSKAEKLRFLFVRVVHVTQEMSGHWILGCSFTWPLSEEELQTFLEE